MTSDAESQSTPSEETNDPQKEAKDLLSKPPALSPLVSLRNQLDELRDELKRVASAAQTNDHLLIDAVANLEMRLNLQMAILHDLANQQVKFENKEVPHRKDNRTIDVKWYYEEYMRKVMAEEEAQKSAMEQKEAETLTPDKLQAAFPQDAVIFGGSQG